MEMLYYGLHEKREREREEKQKSSWHRKLLAVTKEIPRLTALVQTTCSCQRVLAAAIPMSRSFSLDTRT